MKMQIKKIVTVAAATLVLSGAVVGGAAVASSRHADNNVNPGKHSVTQGAASSSTDTDTIQQGDQTGPETPDPTGTTGSGSEGETGTESGAETETSSDGPGGHADPTGAVDHQFEGEE
jgi:hypothetical protein